MLVGNATARRVGPKIRHGNPKTGERGGPDPKCVVAPAAFVGSLVTFFVADVYSGGMAETLVDLMRTDAIEEGTWYFVKGLKPYLILNS